MVELTDIQQYLDDDGLIDEDCRDPVTAIFLTDIVESASENPRLPLTEADSQCINSSDNELCLGEIEVWIYAESDYIGWECVKCGDAGAISNWQDTRWDRRDTTNH